jgi:hypothetical protein
MCAWALGACATTSTKPGQPVADANGPTGPKRVKLAVLKVESDQFPDLAKALNDQMRDVQVKGVDDYFISKVTLEVVQLSIECVEQTPACFGAVGKSLSAQRLLVAHITAGVVPKKGRKKDRVAPVTIAVTQVDAEAGTALQQAEKQFKNEKEAIQGLNEVVQQAAGAAVVAAPPASEPASGGGGAMDKSGKKTKPQARAGR